MTPDPKRALRLAAVLVLAAAPFAAARAQGTEEQQQACTPDAVKLCSDTIPDIPKTTACMKAHFAQLSPRCQAAFNDATGGKAKAKTAVAKATPRAEKRVHAERRAPDHVMAARTEREPLPSRAEAPTAAPSAEQVDPTLAPHIAGYPAFPSPDAPLVKSPATASNSPIARACRAGLIDSFTCSTTVPALLGTSVY